MTVTIASVLSRLRKRVEACRTASDRKSGPTTQQAVKGVRSEAGCCGLQALRISHDAFCPDAHLSRPCSKYQPSDKLLTAHNQSRDVNHEITPYPGYITHDVKAWLDIQPRKSPAVEVCACHIQPRQPDTVPSRHGLTPIRDT